MNQLAEKTQQDSEDVRDTTTSEATPVPNKEELALLCKDIQANYDANVIVKPVIFNFKTVKEKDDETGAVVETKRPALELPVPYLSVEGIIAVIEAGGKDLELLQSAVDGIVTGVARSMISDDLTLNATTLPIEKLTWTAIANMPKAERSGGGIAKEVWDDFGEDYVKVMPAVTGKAVDPVARAAKLMVGKWSACKTNFPVLEMLQGQLALYIEHSPRADEFVGCVEFLIEKADKLVNTTPEELLANL